MINVLLDGIRRDDQAHRELVTLLNAILVRGTVRYDDQEITRILDDPTLPPQVQYKLYDLFKQLRTRNRIFTCDDYDEHCLLRDFGCSSELLKCDTLIRGSGSLRTASTQLSLTDVLTNPVLDRLSQTDLSYKAKVKCSDFESEIIEPFAKFSRSILIVDRFIATNWPRFQKSVEWLVSSVRLYSQSPITIRTAIPRKESDNGNRKAFEGWAQENRIEVKLNAFHKEPHSRGIISDRLGLRIDCGFDLLISGGRFIKATAIHVIPDLNRCEFL